MRQAGRGRRLTHCGWGYKCSDSSVLSDRGPRVEGGVLQGRPLPLQSEHHSPSSHQSSRGPEATSKRVRLQQNCAGTDSRALHLLQGSSPPQPTLDTPLPAPKHAPLRPGHAPSLWSRPLPISSSLPSRVLDTDPPQEDPEHLLSCSNFTDSIKRSASHLSPQSSRAPHDAQRKQ